jgi:hypothetical protein
VGVFVGVPVGGTAVFVGVLVGVLVGTTAVFVGVLVGVFVDGTAVFVGVLVGVFVAVFVGVLVGVLVGVAAPHGEPGKISHIPRPCVAARRIRPVGWKARSKTALRGSPVPNGVQVVPPSVVS